MGYCLFVEVSSEKWDFECHSIPNCYWIAELAGYDNPAEYLDSEASEDRCTLTGVWEGCELNEELTGFVEKAELLDFDEIRVSEDFDIPEALEDFDIPVVWVDFDNLGVWADFDSFEVSKDCYDDPEEFVDSDWTEVSTD